MPDPTRKTEAPGLTNVWSGRVNGAECRVIYERARNRPSGGPADDRLHVEMLYKDCTGVSSWVAAERAGEPPALILQAALLELVGDPGKARRGRLYQHYKGGQYVYLGLAEDVNNESPHKAPQAVYYSVSTGRLYVRSDDEFFAYAPMEAQLGNPEESALPRFRLIEEGVS